MQRGEAALQARTGEALEVLECCYAVAIPGLLSGACMSATGFHADVSWRGELERLDELLGQAGGV